MTTKLPRISRRKYKPYTQKDVDRQEEKIRKTKQHFTTWNNYWNWLFSEKARIAICHLLKEQITDEERRYVPKKSGSNND